MMIIIGAFGFFEGLAALIHGDFFTVGRHYAYAVDVTAYGWWNLIWGLIVAATGFGVLAARTWARWSGIIVLAIYTIGQFFYIPYSAIWSVLSIAPCVCLPRALAVSL